MKFMDSASGGVCFQDYASVYDLHEMKDGNLSGLAKVARTGIQFYHADEVGKTGGGIVRVYRPEEEVFDGLSMASYSSRPVTDDHPPYGINPDTFNEEARGTVSRVKRDGEWVVAAMAIQDRSLIDKVKAGKHEVSMGYTADLDWSDGVTPNGQPYDAVQRNIRINHLAVVDRGRANQLVHDSKEAGNRKQWGVTPVNDSFDRKEKEMSVNLQTIVLGDKAVQVAQADASAVETFKTETQKQIDDLKSAHQETVADKDKELAEKDAKIADLEKKVLDDAALDAKVQGRADLIADASKLVKDADFSGLSDADIRKAAVAAVHGEGAVKDKSEAYIDAAFDIALKSIGSSDPVRDALMSRPANIQDQDTAIWDQAFKNAGVKKKEA